jgi:hypothetical protein
VVVKGRGWNIQLRPFFILTYQSLVCFSTINGGRERGDVGAGALEAIPDLLQSHPFANREELSPSSTEM